MADVILIGTELTSSEAWANGGQFGLCRFQALKSGSLTSIRVLIAVADGTYYGMVALYADNSGEPGTLLTSCASTAYTGGGDSWKSFSVTPYDITADTYYWLAYVGDQRGPFYRSATSGTQRYRAVTYSGFSFPSPPTGLGSYRQIFLYSGWGTEAAAGGSLVIQNHRRRFNPLLVR